MAYIFPLIIVFLLNIQYSRSFSSPSSVHKLGAMENKELQNICGIQASKAGAVSKMFGSAVKSARLGQYPWAVAIRTPENGQTRGGKPMCTGSLISKRHILTAAHCFVRSFENPNACKSLTPNEVLDKHHRVNVLLGEVDVMENGGQWVTVTDAKITIHPEYNCMSHDLAILELDEDIEHKMATPICLPGINMQLANNFEAAGWGTAFKDSEDYTTSYAPNELMWGPIESRDEATCPDYSKETLKVSICTAQGKIDTCKGDSGGPLMQTMAGANSREQKYYLLGVTSGSLGVPCGQLSRWVKRAGAEEVEKKTKGGLFADVRAGLNFISDVTGIWL